MGDEAVGLFENFGRGGIVMGLPVGVVAVLVGVEVAVRVGGVDLLYPPDGAVRTFRRVVRTSSAP